jgi:hypothetical protein
MFRVLVPFSWLIMVVPRSTTSHVAVLRAYVGLLGAVLSFYPFPVAGHQIDIGALIPVAMLPVLGCDVLVALRDRNARLFSIGRPGQLFAALVLLLFFAEGTAQSGRLYRDNVPLDLPGTALIRLPQDQVNTLRWVVGQLGTCKSSFSMPGLLSFAFWTGHALLTPMNINHVLAFIRPDRQLVIVQALRESPGLCVVYHEHLLRLLDRGQIATDPPLLRYIRDEFVPANERAGYAILKPKPVAN